ncbi:calcium-binding protein [Bradyrhizobium sp. B097]|uniref:calcium-binding protein n=1 Tax=Bradyrhizobium sp. B097 TaxID=3140244 RepID=UPI003183AC26
MVDSSFRGLTLSYGGSYYLSGIDKAKPGEGPQTYDAGAGGYVTAFGGNANDGFGAYLSLSGPQTQSNGLGRVAIPGAEFGEQASLIFGNANDMGGFSAYYGFHLGVAGLYIGSPLEGSGGLNGYSVTLTLGLGFDIKTGQVQYTQPFPLTGANLDGSSWTDPSFSPGPWPGDQVPLTSIPGAGLQIDGAIPTPAEWPVNPDFPSVPYLQEYQQYEQSALSGSTGVDIGSELGNLTSSSSGQSPSFQPVADLPEFQLYQQLTSGTGNPGDSNLSSSQSAQSTDDVFQQAIDNIGSTNQTISNEWSNAANSTSDTTSGQTTYPQNPVTVDPSGKPTSNSGNGNSGNPDNNNSNDGGTDNPTDGQSSGDGGGDGGDGPVVLDLTGNGINITKLTSSNTFVDSTGDGFKNRTAWAGAGNAVLFFDPNNTNTITQANQIAFKDWDPTATTDMQALLDVFDTNHDGKLDAGDAGFADFKLMVTNADGTQSVISLADAGITSIDLSANNVHQQLSDGSSIDGETTYTTTSGATGTAATVTFAYDSQGYAVRTTTSTDATTGVVTVDNKALNSDGSLANETISITSADGKTRTVEYDLNGDGQIDVVQTDNTVTSAGVTTETLTDATLAGVLIDRTVTVTSVDPSTGIKTVTIDRDANGSIVGGVYVSSQHEVDTTSNGLTTVLLQDLNPDGSIKDQTARTPSEGGLISTVQYDINGDGVFDLTTVTATVVDATTGTRTTTVTDRNADGSERDQTVTVASADGQSKTVTSDLNGDGVVDLTTTSNIVQGTSSGIVAGVLGATTTIVETAANGALISEVVRFESNDGLIKVVQSDTTGAGTSAAPVFNRTTTDVTVVDGTTGTRTETVIDRNADGSLLDQRLTIIGTDGISRTTELDTTGSIGNSGSSVFDKVETVAVGAAGSIVDTASTYAVNGTLIGRTVITTSADGLTKTVQADLDGNGTIDWTTTTTTAAIAGGGSTVTMTDAAGNGTIVDSTVKTTSADGLTITTQSDVGGDDLRSTDATTVDASTGVRTETVSVASANGTLESQVVTVTSADRNNETVSSDFNGDGHVDQVETIVKQSSGSVVDTVSSYASDGTLVAQTVSTTSADGLSKAVTSNVDGKVDSTTTDSTVLNADGSRTETVTRSSNDGSQVSQTVTTVGATGLSSTVTRNIDGKVDGTTSDITVLNADGSRTETVSSFDSTGAKISSTATTTSANGLSATTLIDENGDGVTDVTRSDSVMIGANGSRTETITNTNANGTLRNQTVTTTSANGLNSTADSDTTGDGAIDRIVSVVTLTDGDVVKTTSIQNQDGSLVGSTVTTMSANGLSRTTQTDANGDGIFDETRTDVTVLNADGSRTETVTDVVGTTTVSSAVTTTSADRTSTTSTTTTDGVLQEIDSSVTSYGSDGSRTQTVTVKSGDGTTQSTTVTTTSADRKTTTVQKNTYGPTPRSSIETRATQTDGSIVDTLSDYDALGALVARALTTTSANGLSVTTAFDDNGDGSVDETERDVKSIGVNGSVTETFSDSSNALHAISGGYTESASVVTVTSANGLSRTITTTGTNGQASLDHSAVIATVINADGSQTTTDTETVGAAQDVAATTVDRTGLTVTKEWSTLGNGVFDHVDVMATNLDGSTTETITNLNADGSTGEFKTINVSQDGRTKTISDMTSEHGLVNTAVTSITPSTNGDTVRVTTNTNGSGTLISKVTETRSANGFSDTIGIDTNGDGTVDESETNTTVLNADGSRTVTLVNTFQRIEGDSSETWTEQHVTTTSADGLSVTTAIYIGDVLNRQTTSVKTNNSDGSTTVAITQKAMASDPDVGLYLEVVGSTDTTTSADGKSVTTTHYAYGDGSPDEVKTSKTAANGVTTVTDTDYDLLGRITDQTITTTSADQRDVTIARNNLQKPASDTLETTLVSADGSCSYSWTEQNSTGTYVVVADHLVDSNGIDTVSLTQNGIETTYKIAQSQEAADLAEIQRIYWVALGRMMKPEEGQTWLKYLTPSGLDVRQLASDLLATVGFGTTPSSGGSGDSTPSFSSNFTSDLGVGVSMSGLDYGDADFVSSMYQNTFGRQASDAELNTWTSQLAAGSITRADVVLDLSRLQGQITSNVLASNGDMSVEYRPDGKRHLIRPDRHWTYKIIIHWPDDPPPNPRDPLVINFGTGDLQLTSLANSQAHFDFTGSGFATQTGWIGANEGILILDNGQGGSTITPDELLGAKSGDGFQDLAALDSNHDGVIDANDAAFSQLKVWTDQNLNGQLDAGELESLSDLGITSISLSTSPVNLTVSGNQVVEQATVMINGVAHVISEVEFSTNTVNTIYTPPADFTYTPEALNLPDLAGFGKLPSLQVAMSQNATLLSDVKNVVLYAGQMTGAQFDAAFQVLLYEWAGASGIDPASRGPYIDARQLAVVYAYYGIDPTSQPAYALNPNSHTGPQWERIYQGLVGAIEVRFASQIIDSLFANGVDIASLQSNPFVALSDIGYDPTTDDISVNFDELVTSIVSHAPTDAATAGSNYYDLTFRVVRGLSKDLFAGDTLALATQALTDLTRRGVTSTVEKVAATALGVNIYDEGAAVGAISIGATRGVVFMGSGDKTITGGVGDLYVYSSDGGNDIVGDTGFGANLMMTGVASSNVILQADTAGDLIIKRLDTGTSVTFEGELGLDIASRTNSRLSTIAFGDGVTWTLPQNLTFTWTGTATDTTLTGVVYGPNIFNLGPGGDVVNAKTANDLFVFGKGDGQATVNLAGGGLLKMGAGITASDLILQSNANGDLIIKLVTTGDSITLVHDLGKDIASRPNSVAGAIEFADGSSINLSQPLTYSYTGTTTDTTLVGSTFGSNVFDLGPGGDTVTAGSATDEFDFDKGDGQATVTLDGGGTVKMAADVAPSDVILQSNANGDLIIKVGSGDSITLLHDLGKDIASRPNSVAGAIEFADGSSINLNQPLRFSYTGTPTDTTLVGSTFGSNIFDLGPGGDTVTAGSATDEFDFDKGDGQATVTLDGGGTVKMAADVAPSDVILQSNAENDLIIKLVGTGDSITLLHDLGKDIASRPNSVAGAIEFADGSSINLNQPLTYSYTGTPTDTTLVGSTFGSNIFDLGPGGDTVTAGSATDEFDFDKGDGQATVTLDGGGTVKMAADVAPSDVILQSNAENDLIIELVATGDSITLLHDLRKDIASRPGSVVGAIEFADGSSIDLNQPLTFTEIGTAGDTNLVGSNFGPNIFILGAGGDTVTATTANDVFEFGKGDGQAIVTLAGGGTVKMAEGIAPSDVVLQANQAGDLTIKLLDTGDSITLLRDLNISSQTTSLATITFADGTTWDSATIGSNVVIVGTNIVNYSKGDGALDVPLNRGTTVIDFGSGISAQDLFFQAQDSTGDLTITFAGNSSDKITIHKDLSFSNGAISSGVTQLNFSDGSSINLDDPLTYTWLANQTWDTLTGSGFGSNVYDITAGRATVDFPNAPVVAGTNVVNYAAGSGQAAINLDGGTGELDFGAGISASNLVFAADSSGDLTIGVAGSSDTIQINGDLVAQGNGTFTSGINKLRFSDGSVEYLGSSAGGSGPLTFTWLANQTWDTLTGSGFGSNVYDITAGRATVNFPSAPAVAGTNIVNYAAGSGQAAINLDGGTGELDFGAGISASNLVFAADSSGDLTIGVAGSSDTIQINGDLVAQGNGTFTSGINKLRFSDGSVEYLGSSAGGSGPLTFTWLANQSWDTLTGSGFGSNVYDITAGRAAVNFPSAPAVAGTNIVNYAAGSGQAAINLDGGTGEIDFGAGISASNLVFTADSSGDLTIGVAGSSDTIQVNGDLVAQGNGTFTSGINKLRFSDGSVEYLGSSPGENGPLTFTWLANQSWDTLTGSGFGSNVYDITAGHAVVDFPSAPAVAGTNIVNYAAGSGQAAINLDGGTGEIDIGSGLSASDVYLQTDNSGDLVIGIDGDPGDTITVNHDLTDNGGTVSSGISQIRFADGSGIDIGQGTSPTFTWIGVGNASMQGSSYGANIFDLGPGSESATGGTTSGGGNGNNTYVVSSSTGQATINANASPGSTNELDFVGGITDENLWFQQSGNDLKIDLLGTDTQVNIAGWFNGGASQLQEINAAGLKIDSQISQLVQAMATYSASNAGFDPTSSSITTIPNDASLQNAVGAAWH